MKSDEFKIILEDINEKFDLVIEGHKLLHEKLDRQAKENKEEHKEIRDKILYVKKDVSEIRRDLNEHRENTELHGLRKKKRAS